MYKNLFYFFGDSVCGVSPPPKKIQEVGTLFGAYGSLKGRNESSSSHNEKSTAKKVLSRDAGESRFQTN